MNRLAVLVGLAGFLACAQAVASAPDTTPLLVSSVRSLPVAVAAWDPNSAQHLVRIDGALYQEDAGWFYRVIDDRITVRLADGVADWPDLVARAGAADPRTFGPLSVLIPERMNRLGIVDLRVPDGDPVAWCERVHRTGLSRYAEVATWGAYLATPNDPLYSQQWALHNTGQTGGTPGADVDAEAAWEITSGNPSVIVGILDSGTSVTHQDLAANVWINEDETPGNGVDDDGNGFIDDWRGWDFPHNNNDPTSSNYHGTHVAGIIIAVGGNGIGITGLAGGLGVPGARGMAIEVGESAPVGSILDDALIYAADNGARVITMSLTVGSSQAINDALGYAYNSRDVLIDCAAGNNGSSVGYPANRPEVMAVASTTPNDTKSNFSNPGPELAVAAPGSDILSTQLNNGYGTSSGTSFAAPYVGALAALVRGVNPGLGAPEVRQLIIDTADDVESPGFDTKTGWGRINAHQAVAQAGSPDGQVDLDAEAYACSGPLGVTLSDIDLAGLGQTAVTLKSTAEPSGEALELTEVGYGVFSGSLQLTPGGGVQDGLLAAAHGDTITAEYLDASDGQGGIDILKTDTAAVDCQGPQILGLAVSGVDDSQATVGWTTSERATGRVRYGSALPLDQEVLADHLTFGHALVLPNLASCTTYKYEVESVDELGNPTVDDNAGQYYKFQTLGDFPGIGVVPCQKGLAQLDRPQYGCSGVAQVVLTDIDLDLDPGAPDACQVLVTSTSEPAGEWIVLGETAVDSGTFAGTVLLGAQAPDSDGMLSVAAGDLVTVTYFDANDGTGQHQVATATATTDCTGPLIQSVQVTAVSATRAEITWTTDEPATSRIDFGSSATLGSFVENTALGTSHKLAISAFEACDRAFFRVTSADQFGDARSADAAGAPFAFNLNRIGGLLFHDNFETGVGWSLTGEWERGAPQGAGSGSGDAPAAYSGAAVLGTDLSGTGGFPGGYEPNSANAAHSPPFSTIGVLSVELILRRKLGLAAGDTANISVASPFTKFVWSSTTATDEGEWAEWHYAMPSAANKAAVTVGFGLTAGAAGQSYGWNIDEVIVKDQTQPDYLSCGGCEGAPSFGGLASVEDLAPCSASGLALVWQPAAAWGTGTGGTYEVHRGASSDFVPADANRVVAGLTGTTWVDAGAPVNTPVWYVVRARNNEGCAGGQGLADDNLRRLSAAETLDQPAPGAVGSTLEVDPVGAAHVRLTWTAVPGADHYVVRRSSSMDFSGATVIGQTTQTLFEDVDAMGDGGSYAYRVFTANACGVEE